jgi:hypothetical protein
MKTIKLLCALAFAGTTLVACGGVEGTYTLDKDATKKANEDEIAKMPADKQQFAKLGMAMMDSLQASIEIKKDGTTTRKMSMGTDKADEESGTWKKDGDKIVLTNKGKDISCEKSGKKLTCTETHKSGDSSTMVFTKS